MYLTFVTFVKLPTSDKISVFTDVMESLLFVCNDYIPYFKQVDNKNSNWLKMIPCHIVKQFWVKTT